MALSLRFPTKPAAQSSNFAIDFANLIPPGQAIASATVAAVTNTNPTAPAPEVTLGTPTHYGRRVFCTVSGGTAGTDYQLTFTATDTLNNIWPRTALMLCAATS
jgi:hypothetical protein